MDRYSDNEDIFAYNQEGGNTAKEAREYCIDIKKKLYLGETIINQHVIQYLTGIAKDLSEKNNINDILYEDYSGYYDLGYDEIAEIALFQYNLNQFQQFSNNLMSYKNVNKNKKKEAGWILLEEEEDASISSSRKENWSYSDDDSLSEDEKVTEEQGQELDFTPEQYLVDALNNFYNIIRNISQVLARDSEEGLEKKIDYELFAKIIKSQLDAIDKTLSLADKKRMGFHDFRRELEKEAGIPSRDLGTRCIAVIKEWIGTITALFSADQNISDVKGSLQGITTKIKEISESNNPEPNVSNPQAEQLNDQPRGKGEGDDYSFFK